MKYHEKLAVALRARLGDNVEVYTDSHHISLDRTGLAANARAGAFIPSNIDRRAAPTDKDVSEIIATAARRLRSDIPKYKPEYVEPGRTFAAELDAAAGKVA